MLNTSAYLRATDPTRPRKGRLMMPFDDLVPDGRSRLGPLERPSQQPFGYISMWRRSPTPSTRQRGMRPSPRIAASRADDRHRPSCAGNVANWGHDAQARDPDDALHESANGPIGR